MERYAIINVAPDWEPHQVVGFSEGTVRTLQGEIEAGMRVLLFKTSPVNAIVAECEVPNGQFFDPDNWPDTAQKATPMTGFGVAADYVLPLRVILTRAPGNFIPLSHVEDYIDRERLMNDEWVEITPEDYHVLSPTP
ncbi:MAG: hypothetical protein ACOCXZ_00565 [Chloroflexota bacterium]